MGLRRANAHMAQLNVVATVPITVRSVDITNAVNMRSLATIT